MTIASCLVDTNILLRMTRRSDPQHLVVDAALARLASRETALCYTHQNVAELWNAMTRPLNRNGLGLTVTEAEREVLAIEAGMALLPTTRPFTTSGGVLSYVTGFSALRCTTHVSPQRCTFTESATYSR
jgi:predicted nucleic acid-binding protein